MFVPSVTSMLSAGEFWPAPAGVLAPVGVCVAAVGAFNLFNSLVAGLLLFAGGFAFGCWVTGSDPALLRILAKSEKYKARYDAAKQSIPRVEVRS